MSLTESAVTSASIPSLMGLATIVSFAIAYVRLAVRLVVGTGGSILIDRKGLLLVTGPYLYMLYIDTYPGNSYQIPHFPLMVGTGGSTVYSECRRFKGGFTGMSTFGELHKLAGSVSAPGSSRGCGSGWL